MQVLRYSKPLLLVLLLHITEQENNKDLRELKGKVQAFIDEKDSMSSEHQDLVKRKAKLELNIKDLMDELEGDQTAKVGGHQWWPVSEEMCMVSSGRLVLRVIGKRDSKGELEILVYMRELMAKEIHLQCPVWEN